MTHFINGSLIDKSTVEAELSRNEFLSIEVSDYIIFNKTMYGILNKKILSEKEDPETCIFIIKSVSIRELIFKEILFGRGELFDFLRINTPSREIIDALMAELDFFKSERIFSYLLKTGLLDDEEYYKVFIRFLSVIGIS